METTYKTQCLIHYNNRMLHTPVPKPYLSQLATYEEEHCYYDNIENTNNSIQEEIYEYINIRKDCFDESDIIYEDIYEECSVYNYQ